jgi:4-amino-4-deoxy-L-arabinose transferase-like glycosyltransferase
MKQKTIGYGLLILEGILLVSGIFSYAMNADLDHDENMYVGAGVLLRDGFKLYQDFSYVQMPYLPMVYGAIYKLMGGSYYLLYSRLLNVFAIAIAAIAIYLISYKVCQDRLVANLAILMLVFNELIINIIGKASNDLMALSFSVLGFCLFIYSIANKVNSVGLFLGGVCLSIAVCTKLYYAVTIPPFLLISLVYPVSLRLKKRIFSLFLPLIAGVFTGALPAFHYLMQNPEVFMFNNLGYHLTNTQWREITGFDYTMSLGSKLLFGKKILMRPTNFTLLMAILLLIVVKFKSIKQNNFPNPKRLPDLDFVKIALILALLLLAIATVNSFVPTPIWKQHFTMPVAFAIILIPSLYATLAPQHKSGAKIRLTGLVVVIILSGGFKLYRFIPQLDRPSQWQVIAVHETAQKIRKSVESAKGSTREQKIATLVPLYAVEGGLKIYNELSAGPFMYRIGDLIPPETREKVRGTSPQSIGVLLDRDPPAAIWVGFEGDLDKPLIDYARENHYTEVKENLGKGTLYLHND